MIYKAIDFVGNTRDIDTGKRTAVIKYATYGSYDRDQDRANKGMFTKSWNDNFSDIRFFLNHDKLLAPGKPIRFWEDDNHAYAELKFGTHTLGEDVFKMMQEGIITNNSYGFDPVAERTSQINGKGKDFKEVRLWEVSVLTHWGAHPESLVDSVSEKAAKVEKMMARLKEMESFVRNTTASDETIQNVLTEIGEMKKSLGSDATNTPDDEADQQAQLASVNKEFADSLYLLTFNF